MAFRKSDIPHELPGFGYVVPAAEKRDTVGCTFTSRKYAGRTPEDGVLLRAFVGGAFHRHLVDLDDDTLKQLILREFQEVLGIEAQPFRVLIRRYPQSMPQYCVGHLDRVEAIEKSIKQIPGLHLTGNALRGVGIPDCIHQAEKVAEAIVDEL